MLGYLFVLIPSPVYCIFYMVILVIMIQAISVWKRNLLGLQKNSSWKRNHHGDMKIISNQRDAIYY